MKAPVIPFGLSALVDADDSKQAQAIAGLLRSHLGSRIGAVVPGADSVLVHATPELQGRALSAALSEALALDETAGACRSGRVVELPVIYDGADLGEVAATLAMPVEEVIARHTCATYDVEFLGFAPGFPYLSGLDPALRRLGRRQTPRTHVPRGSVGIAAGRTCVYPTDSPGGWHLLGHTEAVLFDPDRDQPSLLMPGDTVRFVAVS